MVLPWQEAAWLCMTFLIFLTWWVWFAKSRAGRFSPAERLLAAFVCMIGQIEATTFVAGFLHAVAWWPLGALNVAVTLAVGIRALTLRRPGSFTAEVTLLGKTGFHLLRSSSGLLMMFLLTLFVAAWYTYLGQLLPPVAFDAWGYHYTWAAMAHQERHLGPFEFPSAYVNNFPKNTDILFLWSIVGCGTERFANIAQAPFAPAAALGSYLLARRIGARRVDAAIAGLLVFSVPTVYHMMWKGMVDLAMMGGTIAAAAFLARRRLNPTACAVAGCAAGFVFGSKGSSVYFFVPLVLLLLYRLFPLGMDGFRHARTQRLKGIVWALLTFGLMSFLFGSYFYLRNWVTTGNPTGIYTVDVAGLRLFEGSADVGEAHFSRELLGAQLYDALNSGPEWPIVFDGFFDPQEVLFQGNRIGGWGPAWTILLLPAIPIALIWALLRRRWNVIAIIVCCLLPFFLFKYNHTWTRYHLPIIAAGTTAFAYLLALLGRSRYRRQLIALAVLFTFLGIVISGPQNIVSVKDIAQARKQPYLQGDRYFFMGSFGDRSFVRSLNLVRDPGTTITLMDGAPKGKTLAMWNQSFTNRVIWVAWPGSGEKWEGALRETGADAVYIRSRPDAIKWATNHPDRFLKIYSSPDLGAIFVFTGGDEHE